MESGFPLQNVLANGVDFWRRWGDMLLLFINVVGLVIQDC